jgi:hypothetical protein
MIYEPIQVYEGDGIDRGSKQIKCEIVTECGDTQTFYVSDYIGSDSVNVLKLIFNNDCDPGVLEKHVDFSFSKKLHSIKKLTVFGLGSFFDCFVAARDSEANYHYGCITVFTIKFQKFSKGKV